MANLIITVISIALVTIAALMGAYYGGNAFLDGQMKANANTVIQQANQIKGAYALFLANGNDPLPNGQQLIPSNSFSGDPKYFSAVPYIPPAIQWTAAPAWQIYSNGPGGATYQRLVVGVANIKICNVLAQIFTQQDAGPGATAFTRLGQYGADCYFDDNNGNGVYDAGDNAFFHITLKN